MTKAERLSLPALASGQAISQEHLIAVMNAERSSLDAKLDAATTILDLAGFTPHPRPAATVLNDVIRWLRREALKAGDAANPLSKAAR